MIKLLLLLFIPVLWRRIQSDPFQLGGAGSRSAPRQAAPVPGSWQNAWKIPINIRPNYKNNIFSPSRNHCFLIHMNNKLINNQKEIILLSIMFLMVRNQEKKLEFRIRYFSKRIRGSGSRSEWNGSTTLIHSIFIPLSCSSLLATQPEYLFYFWK